MPNTTAYSFGDVVLVPFPFTDQSASKKRPAVVVIREDQRVRVIVESLDEEREDRAAALARLKAGIASMQFFSGGRLPSRAELHDRL